MHFEGAEQTGTRSNGRKGAKVNQNGSGNKISLPIRVRPPNMPWYEEAMTLEVSRDKLKFVTNRQYAFGQRLLIAFGGEAPWSGDGEWETEVTGIEMEAGHESLCVTVRKKS